MESSLQFEVHTFSSIFSYHQLNMSKKASLARRSRALGISRDKNKASCLNRHASSRYSSMKFLIKLTIEGGMSSCFSSKSFECLIKFSLARNTLLFSGRCSTPILVSPSSNKNASVEMRRLSCHYRSAPVTNRTPLILLMNASDLVFRHI